MNSWICSGMGSNSIGRKRYKRDIYPIPQNINWIGKEAETEEDRDEEEAGSLFSFSSSPLRHCRQLYFLSF